MRARSYDARNFYEVQRFARCPEQGRLAEVLADLELAVEACLGPQDGAGPTADPLIHLRSPDKTAPTGFWFTG